MARAAVNDIEPPRSRPFGLGDAMILIVALALGLALAGPGILIIADAISSVPRSHLWTWAGAVQLGRFLNIVVLNFLFFLIPACLILRLRHPRAPLRSLIHQPGFAACAAPFAFFLAALPLALLAPSGLAGQVIGRLRGDRLGGFAVTDFVSCFLCLTDALFNLSGSRSHSGDRVGRKQKVESRSDAVV
jgi:hypothetical protein